MAQINPKADVLIEDDDWYPATIHEKGMQDTEYGEKLVLQFDVVDRDDQIVEVTAWLTFSDHPKSNLVKWAKGLFGERPFDTDEFDGASCEVFLELGKDKQGEPKNFIRRVRRPKAEKAKAGATGKTADAQSNEVPETEESFSDLPF